jgi:hypothetical protein
LQFLAVTGTEDAAAAEAMLDGNGWNVEGAIDFFFATGTTGDESGVAGGGGAGGAPALGLRGVGGMEENMGDDAATAGLGVEDEDAELQRGTSLDSSPNTIC